MNCNLFRSALKTAVILCKVFARVNFVLQIGGWKQRCSQGTVFSRSAHLEILGFPMGGAYLLHGYFCAV